MAKIGLRNFRYSKLDENDEVTGPKSLGKAIDCKVAIQKNEAVLNADDGVAESDYSFKSGTVTATVDEDADQVFAEILGHKITEDGEFVRNAEDQAPYVAMNRILTKVVNGVRKYKVEHLHKVKFKEPDADETTAGENLEFKTNTIEGAVHKKANGDWSKAKTFDTYAEAEAYATELLTPAN